MKTSTNVIRKSGFGLAVLLLAAIGLSGCIVEDRGGPGWHHNNWDNHWGDNDWHSHSWQGDGWNHH